MPAGMVSPTKVMDKVKTAAESVTALTGRVYQGKKRLAEAENFEGNIRALTAETQGYFAFWLGKRTGRDPLKARSGVVVNGILFVRLPKDTTTDVNLAYEVAEALLRALLTAATFSPIGVGIGEGSYDLTNDDLEDGIAEFDFELEYETGLFC